MRFHPELDKLDGQRVRLSGSLVPAHEHTSQTQSGSGFTLTDDSGLCPDCSPLPVASVFMPTLDNLPADYSADAATITVEGTLSVGFQIDAQQRATLLRLLDAYYLSDGGYTQ